MKVYNWTPPTTKYPDLIKFNIKPRTHNNINTYKFLYTFLILIIIIILILSYYNGS